MTGFVGPLEQVDADERCPLCGLDPEDPSLHGPSCPTVVDDLCGIIDRGRMCLRPSHTPTDSRDEAAWERFRWDHEWQDFDTIKRETD